MDKQDMKQFLAVILGAYPERFTVNRLTAEVWLKMLQDIPNEQALSALEQHIAVSTFAPTVADIRRICLEQSSGDVISPQTAWKMAARVLSAYDPKKTTDALPDLVKAAVQEIGVTFLYGKSKADPFLRKEFLEVYTRLQTRQERQAMLPASLQKALATGGQPR